MLEVKFLSLKAGFNNLENVLEKTQERIESWEVYWTEDRTQLFLVGAAGFYVGSLRGMLKVICLGKQPW